MIDAGELLRRHAARRQELQAIRRAEQTRAAVAAKLSDTTMTIRQWDVYFAAREAFIHFPDIRLRTEERVAGRAVELFAFAKGHAEVSVTIGRAELSDPDLMAREINLLFGRFMVA